MPATARRDAIIRRALAFCAMLAVALAFRAEHLTDWDSWDYAAQAVRGHSSDLLLGRWWFIAFMRTAYLAGRRLFGLTDLNGYLAMQAACSLFMAGAVAAGMAWTFQLTRSVAAEILFAALLVLGPMIGIYAPAVMTEGATVFMMSLSFWAWHRCLRSEKHSLRWAFGAGLAFGVMVTMREQAAVLAAWPIVSCLHERRRRWCGLLAAGLGGMLLTLGIGVLGAVLWYPWDNIGYWPNILRWIASMQQERRQFGVQALANLRWMVYFFFAAAPVMTALLTPAALWSVLRRRRLAWLCAAGGPYFLTLLVNHDLSVNPRFIIPGVWVLAPVAAAALDAALVGRRKRYRLRLACATGAVLIAGALSMTFGWAGVRTYYLRAADRQLRAFRVMLQLPSDAVVIAGPATPVAFHLNRLEKKRFEVIRSGWGWPGEKLAQRVHAALEKGKRVYANMDAESWNLVTRKTDEWRQVQDVAARYALDTRTWPMVELRSPASPSWPARAAPRPRPRHAETND